MKYGPWRFRHYVIGIILKTQYSSSTIWDFSESWDFLILRQIFNEIKSKPILLRYEIRLRNQKKNIFMFKAPRLSVWITISVFILSGSGPGQSQARARQFQTVYINKETTIKLCGIYKSLTNNDGWHEALAGSIYGRVNVGGQCKSCWSSPLPYSRYPCGLWNCLWEVLPGDFKGT